MGGLLLEGFGLLFRFAVCCFVVLSLVLLGFCGVGYGFCCDCCLYFGGDCGCYCGWFIGYFVCFAVVGLVVMLLVVVLDCFDDVGVGVWFRFDWLVVVCYCYV